ncbi:MAG: SsrA-binding protein, partial [Deltaproteobacteria bacterium]|nr:SsrA-binding protein [Deltaproteobacteria bacterium]
MTARPAALSGKPGKKTKDADVRPVARNRKAFHEYFIDEKVEAGLELTGTEVKSLREGRANLTDGWVEFAKGQAWLHGVHVSPYDPGS